MTLDDLLVDAGAELDRLSRSHQPSSLAPQIERRPRIVLGVAAAVMLAAATVGLYTVATRDGSHSVTSPGSSSTPDGSTVTTLATMPPLTRSLTVGSTGDDVALLQHRLTQVGFSVGAVDGAFGSEVQQAVWAFKSLVLGTSYQQLANEADNSTVTPALWQRMIAPVTIRPRRPDSAGHTHVEIYLPLQVLVVFTDNAPILVAHISSGAMNADGTAATWCAQQPTSDPKVTHDVCGVSKTPGGVSKVYQSTAGNIPTDLGELLNPVYFNYNIAVHGDNNVPIEPSSYGTVRINMQLAARFPQLIGQGDLVYVWDYDGKEPEQSTTVDMIPLFPYPNPHAPSTATVSSGA